jgi:hypothetical protein
LAAKVATPCPLFVGGLPTVVPPLPVSRRLA